MVSPAARAPTGVLTQDAEGNVTFVTRMYTYRFRVGETFRLRAPERAERPTMLKVLQAIDLGARRVTLRDTESGRVTRGDVGAFCGVYDVPRAAYRAPRPPRPAELRARAKSTEAQIARLEEGLGRLEAVTAALTQILGKSP